MELKDRRIILGVTGSIAIHKSIDLASQLVKHCASVHVVMTENATRLVQPLQFQVISRNPVLLDLFNAGSDWKPTHVDLADRADLLAIAPADRKCDREDGKWHCGRCPLNCCNFRPLSRSDCACDGRTHVPKPVCAGKHS